MCITGHRSKMSPIPFLALLCLGLTTSACSTVSGCVLRPDEPFSRQDVPPGPDYGQEESWAALPGREDLADLTPPGMADAQAEARADVFFVHPTTWFDSDRWNDPMDDPRPREIVDQLIMAGQASAFNGCCRVYAPRYRQATIGAYFTEAQASQQAFEVAYQDVERAFTRFLEAHNQGRPFILASHSQGSMHAMRLLERIDADPALRERLVAAYIPGFAHPMERFEAVYQHLEPCREPRQTGCVISWDTFRQGSEADHSVLVQWTGDKLQKFRPGTLRQCTNPITWRADGQASARAAHRGAVQARNEGEEIEFPGALFSDEPAGVKITALEAPQKGLLTAQCVDGVLYVPDLEELDYRATETDPGNYHLLDYQLFYADIRHNAIERVEAWLEAHEGGGADPQGREEEAR